MPLADVSGLIASTPHQLRIAVLPLGCGHAMGAAESVAVDALMATQQQSRTTGPASRLGDVRVLKTRTSSQQGVNVRSLDPRVSHRGKRIVALIVGQNEQQIRTFVCDELRRIAEREAERNDDEKQMLHGDHFSLLNGRGFWEAGEVLTSVSL